MYISNTLYNIALFLSFKSVSLDIVFCGLPIYLNIIFHISVHIIRFVHVLCTSIAVDLSCSLLNAYAVPF